MPKSEQLFSEVRKYIAIWITEISLSNSASFFDINKISEGTSKVLLNMIYDYNLSDLNEKKLNFPGIDLGDEKNGISFQVTSENSSQKIISTLKTFRKNNYELDFPKGVKFLVLNKKKNYRFNKVFEEYKDIFDAKNDIVFPDDLVKEIQGIYYNKKALFEQIFDFLKDEFAFDNNKKTSELLKLNSPSERFDFYKKVLNENFKPKIKNFVHFGCSYRDSIISTVDLINLINESNGLIITGPSGCGKSLLSQKLAVA